MPGSEKPTVTIAKAVNAIKRYLGENVRASMLFGTLDVEGGLTSGDCLNIPTSHRLRNNSRSPLLLDSPAQCGQRLLLELSYVWL